MAEWIAFPYPAAGYAHDVASLRTHWARLHLGDAEPLPGDEAVLAAWALFHAGDFQKAHDAGLRAGGAGITVANKAQALHANYLEKSERTKAAMFRAVAQRAEAQLAADPKLASAHYWRAYALGRHHQGMSVAQVIEDDLGAQVRSALEMAIELSPRHADAHIALGVFHADVIDKVGRLLGKTQGADAALALKMFREALVLHPDSAIARIEYANGLVMLEGEKRLKECDKLYTEAAACTPADATERLEVELAKAELADTVEER
jgi:tetratricopeptide (TPR) repeat protein